MHATTGNFGLGILCLLIGALWLLRDINLIPDWFPLWSLFLIFLGMILMWTSVRK